LPALPPCRAALWNLAYRNNHNRKAIVHAGAIALLVALLKVGQGGWRLAGAEAGVKQAAQSSAERVFNLSAAAA